MDSNKNKFQTKAIHAGHVEKNPKNALNYPIFMTSTFSFNNLDHAEYTFTHESEDYVYTRGNNPTLRVLERNVAELEKGVDGVAFASGMAAISSTIFSFIEAGDKVIAHKVLYGSSYNLLNNILPKFNVEVELVDLTDINALKAAIDDNTKLIYFETPSNPTLEIIDIKKVAEVAESEDVKVAVDNTFATPYFQNPLELGADVVIHSATKYISGHGDVVAGVAVAKDKSYIQKLKFDYMSEFGGVMSPFNGWLLLRGLKTLSFRMKEHERNAKEIAEFMQDKEIIKKVYYPGLKNFKGHEIAAKQMRGFGAMIAFEMDADLDTIDEFLQSLEMIKLAVSLGDAETLIEYPFGMTHRDYTEEQLKKFGLKKNLLRLSIGLEDATDIKEDLNQALKKIT